MDQYMVDWFKGHVNCLEIKHFEGRHFCKGTELSIFTNLRTVRLPPKALAVLSKAIFQVFPTVQYLDLRGEKELFHSECIEQIRELFPNVEHLVFNTQSLDCVPTLACCLPRLRSLTYLIDVPIPSQSIDLVVCYMGLHHLPQNQLEIFLKTIYRILRPNARHSAKFNLLFISGQDEQIQIELTINNNDQQYLLWLKHRCNTNLIFQYINSTNKNQIYLIIGISIKHLFDFLRQCYHFEAENSLTIIQIFDYFN
ncbi:unnamed protein product [Adineta steineri]|uniref:Methyltransferase type 11 domain-containing protein n=1 Tax=Adineta steineri TaxID=433720 RepID=A0A819G3T5_9BILA|nr:unnamed protein product [Adineta steineri]CAF3873675.1 unnamed protein product [Adineta steineri]